MAIEETMAQMEAPSLTDAAAGGMPGMPGMPAEGAPPEQPMGGDLEALLSELDAFGAPAPMETPQRGATSPTTGSVAQAMEELGGGGDLDALQSMDYTSQRVARLEQQLNDMNSRNSQLERENTRTGIHNTISEGIDTEFTSLGVDKEGKAGKGLARLIANSVLVSVAQNQAVTGNQSVDPRSIRDTVKNWTKVFSLVAKEIAANNVAEQRLTSAGSQPAPYKVNKPLGELSDEEFGNAVLANLRGGYNS